MMQQQLDLTSLPRLSERSVLPTERAATYHWEFSRSRVRVEALDSYGVPSDDRMLTAFLAGEPSPVPEKGWNDWYAKTRKVVEDGAMLQRIHVIPRVITPYLRYEIELAYAHYNAPAGEDVRLVIREDVPRLATLQKHDFYLFDDSSVVAINYDTAGKLVSREMERNPEAIRWHKEHVADLLKNSLTLKEYLARMRSVSTALPA